jgi:exonuclease SbcD
VVGDVFDNSTPSNHAQELYYRFLYRLAALPNHPVAVKAGRKHSELTFICLSDRYRL